MGVLFVVATPIGNLEDMSPRALRTLAEVDLVAAEDTRHSGALLRHFGITTRLLSYHAHNQRARRDDVLRALAAGDVALISDAGTPGISDPGHDLIEAALTAGHTVSPIPGPTSLAAAVSVSGLVAGPFVFVGFLPRERSARRVALARASAPGFPLVLFESPHRLADSLADLSEPFAERPAAVLRELTKLHEEIRRGTVASLAAWAKETPPRGEVVVVIGGPAAEDGASSPADDIDRLLSDLARQGFSASQAAREAARMTGRPRSELYARAQGIRRPALGDQATETSRLED